jgi:hypothetical protein
MNVGEKLNNQNHKQKSNIQHTMSFTKHLNMYRTKGGDDKIVTKANQHY